MEIIGFPLEASNGQLDNFQKLDNFHWIISSSKLTALQFLDFRHVDILVYWRQSFRHLCYPEKVQICAFCITDSDSVIQIMFDWCIICYIPWWCFIMIIPSFVLYHDYDPSLMHHHIICFYHGLTSNQKCLNFWSTITGQCSIISCPSLWLCCPFGCSPILRFDRHMDMFLVGWVISHVSPFSCWSTPTFLAPIHWAHTFLAFHACWFFLDRYCN